MSYETNIDRANIEFNYLVIIKPRRIVDSTGWSLISATRYYTEFDYGYVSTLDSNGVEQDKASDSTLSDGDWYFDHLTNYLYVDLGSNPNTLTVVVSYEIYLSTYPANYHRDPSDSSSHVVYYPGNINRPPKLDQSVTNILFGFFTTRSTSMSCYNEDNFFNRHVYDSSFNQIEISVWHYAGALNSDNLFNILNGVIGGEVQFTPREVSFTVFETSDIFDREYRNPDPVPSFYSEISGITLDPTKQSAVVRRAYGVVEGYVPINIDFNSDAPTTSNNRLWGVGAAVLSDNSFIKMVSGSVSGSNTTTRTYLPSPSEGTGANGDGVSGFQVGDTIEVRDSTLSPTTQYVEVTAVNHIADYIDHTALTGAGSSVCQVLKAPVSYVIIVQDGVAYKAFYGRDYAYNNSNVYNINSITFQTSLESNISLPNTLSPNDTVYCRYYGPADIPTIGGSDFGSRNVISYNVTNCVVIIYDILTNQMGIPEADIDTASFQALESGAPDVSFVINDMSSDKFPTYKDLLQRLLLTGLYRIFKSSNGKWYIVQTAALGATDISVDDNKYLNDSYKYSFNFRDIYDEVTVEYKHREINEINENTPQVYSETSSYSVSKWLHKVSRQLIVRSYHLFDTGTFGALQLAAKLAIAVGDRQGILSSKIKREAFKASLDDVVEVDSKDTPGFTYSGAYNSRKFAIEASSKSINEIDLTLNDQKGIEDNSGSF